MPAVKIRVLKSADIDDAFKLIYTVSKEFMFPTYSKEGQIEFNLKLEQIKAKLADKKYISIVAEHNGRIIGMVQGSIRDEYGSLGLLFVDKKYHRKGIGTALMKKIETRFRKDTCAVKLYSSMFALKFYQNVGYNKTTGLRSKKGIVYYPMKKILRKSEGCTGFGGFRQINYSLRNPTTNDFDVMYKINKDAYKPYVKQIWGWDERFQYDYFKQHLELSKVKIILDGHLPIGFFSVDYRKNLIFIESVAILSQYRSRGIGTKIMNEIIAQSINLAIPVHLQVFKVNPRAKKLYERLGFVQYGENVTHYKFKKEPNTASQPAP